MMERIEDIMKLLIRDNGSSPIHNCILYLNNPKKDISYNAVFGKINASISKIDQDYCFRTGSITKTFVATIIMQLMEEKKLNIDGFFLDYLSKKDKEFLKKIMFFKGVNYSNQITIKNLLEHSSGLRDYFADDNRFFNYVMRFPLQSWEWKTIMQKYFKYKLHEKGVFTPGAGFYYSDTNYLLLAVLIEELTNMSLHELLEERILTPLSLNDTYLQFHQEPKGYKPVIPSFYGSINLKNINSSFDWGGGGLISSTNDLDFFIRELLSGKLFDSKETLSLMMDFNHKKNINSALDKKRNMYAIGLQQKKIGDYNFIGHNSAYGGMMFYDLHSGLSIILSINQLASPHKAEWLIKKLAQNIDTII